MNALSASISGSLRLSSAVCAKEGEQFPDFLFRRLVAEFTDFEDFRILDLLPAILTVPLDQCTAVKVGF
jgi:hypothetical protein